MRVRVIDIFRDKDDYGREYRIGEECEFEETRALNLSALGLVEPIADANLSENARRRGRKPNK